MYKVILAIGVFLILLMLALFQFFGESILATAAGIAGCGMIVWGGIIWEDIMLRKGYLSYY